MGVWALFGSKAELAGGVGGGVGGYCGKPQREKWRVKGGGGELLGKGMFWHPTK